MPRRALLWRLAMRISMSSVITPAMRIRLLRALGVSVPWSVTLPDGVFIGSPSVRLGEHSGFGPGCILDGSGPLVIEDYVRLGIGVTVVTGTHPIEPCEVRRDPQKATVPVPVTIGRGSWIASRATILADVAPGCVVAAGAVVHRPTEANGFYAGTPARRLMSLDVQS